MRQELEYKLFDREKNIVFPYRILWGNVKIVNWRHRNVTSYNKVYGRVI